MGIIKKLGYLMKKIYYIVSKGSLYLDNGNLYFEPFYEDCDIPKKFKHDNDDEEIQIVKQRQSIPIETTSSICCFTLVQFDSTILNYIAKYNIPIISFDSYIPTGYFYSNFSKPDGNLTVLQAAHFANNSKRLSIARKFVLGAIANKIVNLSYYYNRGAISNIDLNKFTLIISQANKCSDVNQLLLAEAQAQKLYFSFFNQIIKNDNFHFEKRVYFPPPDPVNALISFLNALLYSTLLTEMASTPIYPFISYLHSPGNNKMSLIWDFSEIFKPVVCDRLLFKMLNTNIIKPDMFDQSADKCLLNKIGRHKVVSEYDKKIKTTIFIRENQKQQSYRTIIREEFYKFIRFLQNKSDYKPFRMNW